MFVLVALSWLVSNPAANRAHHAAEQLARGATYVHSVELRRGELLRGVVEQRGVDLILRLKDPAGRLLFEVDSPNGSQGPEPVLHVATTSGLHHLEVSALEPEGAGSFTIDIQEPRAADRRDRQEAEAKALWSSAWTERRIGQEGEAGAARHYERARRHAERALALHESLFGRDHPLVAADLSVLGYILDEIGEYEEGEAAFARALTIRELAGAAEAEVRENRSDLGWLRLMRGNLPGAREGFEAVLADDPHREGTRQGLAEALEAAGEFDRALSIQRELLAEEERARGPQSGGLASPLVRVAGLLLAKGEVAEAEATLDRAAALRRPSPRGRVRDARPLEVEAELAMALGTFDRAERHLTRARELRTAAFGPRHPALARTLTLQGRLALLRGEPDQARGLLREALAIGERSLGPRHLTVASTVHALAEVHEAQGRCPEAHAAYRRAIAIREAQVRPDHPELLRARRALSGEPAS